LLSTGERFLNFTTLISLKLTMNESIRLPTLYEHVDLKKDLRLYSKPFSTPRPSFCANWFIVLSIASFIDALTSESLYPEPNSPFNCSLIVSVKADMSALAISFTSFIALNFIMLVEVFFSLSLYDVYTPLPTTTPLPMAPGAFSCCESLNNSVAISL